MASSYTRKAFRIPEWYAHTSLKQRLREMEFHEQDRVRGCVMNGLEPWKCLPGRPGPFEMELLDSGITSRRFTNTIFLRLCVDILFLRSQNPPTQRDFVQIGPVQYLAHGIQIVDPKMPDLSRGVDSIQQPRGHGMTTYEKDKNDSWCVNTNSVLRPSTQDVAYRQKEC